MNSSSPNSKSNKPVDKNSKDKNKPGNKSPNLLTKANFIAQGKYYLDQYLQIMSRNFKLLGRENQELLIKRICQTLTLGLTSLALVFAYSFIPEIIRIFLVPVAGLLAWWLGSNLVTSVMLDRLQNYLDKEN